MRKVKSTCCSPARAGACSSPRPTFVPPPRPTGSNRSCRCRLRSTVAACSVTTPPPPPRARAANVRRGRRRSRNAPDDNAASIKGTLDKMFSASDAQIGEKLHGSSPASRSSSASITRRRTQGDRKFYAARNYAPLWIADGALNARAKAVIARLKDAAADGLDPADYPVPEFSTAAPRRSPTTTSCSPIRCSLTRAISRSAASRRPACWRKSITAITRRSRPKSCARSPAPATPARRSKASTRRMRASSALKAKLAELRSNAPRAEAAPDNRIPDGALIRPGAKDARVPALRERLACARQAGRSRLRQGAVQRRRASVQDAHDIKPTGIIDGKTHRRHQRPEADLASQTDRPRCSPTWSAGAGCRAISARPM